MPQSSVIRRCTCLATLYLLVSCTPTDPTQGPASSKGGSGGGGGTSSGGSKDTGGTTSGGGTTTTTSTTPIGGSGGSGGTTNTGGSGGSGGTGGTGGTKSTGGSGGSGGTAGSGGTTTTTPTGGTTTPTGGTTSAGGTTGSTTSTGGVKADQSGVPLAKPGDTTSTSKKYFNLGDMRLINNRWGSDELNCGGTTQKVYVNADKSLGWDFSRPACGGAKAKPDYPEIEFGVAPFGAGNVLLTTPAFSSTSALPLQIKDITSSSIKVEGLNITLTKPTIWNINFEMWFSRQNPLTSTNPGVYAEVIAFWGWEDGRWPCDKSGSLTSGTNGYRLCHQSDTWGPANWRFFQFNVDGGPLRSFSGTVDIKVILDWLVANQGFSKDLWLTRLEIGSEIDDNTTGSVKIRNVTFSVNGTSKSPEFAP